MRRILTFILALAATPVAAGIAEVIDAHILPGYAAFAEAASTLNDAASDCTAETIRPAWNDAFDAWIGVSHLRFGPVEQEGRSVVVAFWPDERGATPKALAALIGDEDPIIAIPEGTAQISVAARGLFALEYLLYDPQFAESGLYGCSLVQALTAGSDSLSVQI